MFRKMNLFSKTGIKLLEFLLRNTEKQLYERQISSESGISIGATNEMMKIFAEASIVSREKKGKMYFYTVNMENPVVRQFKILFNIIEISNLLERIKPFSSKIVLFGSSAEGLDTDDSDIDIFILTSNKENVRSELGISRTSKKISPIIIENHRISSFKKENAPLYQNIKRGIVLWDKNGLQV